MGTLKRRPVKCPQCGSKSVLEIVYGMPEPSLFEDAEQGKVILGGCCIEEGQANYGCGTCDWDDSDPSNSWSTPVAD